MTYLLPTSIDSVLGALSTGDSTVVAGATDHYPARLMAGSDDRGIIDISALAELRGISRDTGGWRIGALTTWTDLASASLPPAFRGLQAAARQVGGVQIQNVATIGGNICNASPAADGVPPLLVLDAAVELRSTRGTRVLALSEFLLGNRHTERRPDELLTAVLVPGPPVGGVGSFEKLGTRAYLVISIVMVAALAEVAADGSIDSARVAVGACSPVARRLTDLERDLVGRSLDEPIEDLVTAGHLAPLSPIDDVRASAAYRLAVIPSLVARALRSARSTS